MDLWFPLLPQPMILSKSGTNCVIGSRLFSGSRQPVSTGPGALRLGMAGHRHHVGMLGAWSHPGGLHVSFHVSGLNLCFHASILDCRGVETFYLAVTAHTMYIYIHTHTLLCRLNFPRFARIFEVGIPRFARHWSPFWDSPVMSERQTTASTHGGDAGLARWTAWEDAILIYLGDMGFA